ncbi:MAG: flagellar hook protein FlgE [Alphaproteobacteria bacterium]
MSLGSALNASVSGLKAQSAAIAAVSENIANADTTAYKERTIAFESLITSSSAASSLNQVGGGVTFSTSQNLEELGLIENTGVATNVAINGEGFFIVAGDAQGQASSFNFTRNGDFRTDEDGLLVNNEGMILLAQRTDDDGNVTLANATDLNSLEPVDLATISGTAGTTTEIDIIGTLPSDADVYAFPTGPEFVTSYEFFDALGVSHTVEQTYRKTAVNTWAIEYADPYQTNLGAGSGATGTVDIDTVAGGTQNAQIVTFNGDGSINTIQTGNWNSGTGVFDGTGGTAAAGAQPFDVSVTGLTLTTGADDVTFEVDMGTQNLFDGYTQFASTASSPGIENYTADQDGVRFGQLSGAEIDDTGLVTALFDNGVRRPIYQIPLATFPNPAGLNNVSGTVYDENERAGNIKIGLPGEGSAGNVAATSLELSTVDQAEEFNKMIVAQQAYSSAAQIVSTVDEMFDALLGAVR